jgi:tetratricopeptide (TPR) repeat protein
VASGDETPRVAYRGFISYSHRDAGVGKSIHRRLEAYRLPKHLIGSETALGPVPARLTPIFRDREELSAGESLSDQVQAALAASDCLIVLASPNAKGSKWVAKEIETFRALHPDRPVLAGLIAGEPEDAFPDELTADGAEPIAADFRKGGDGKQLALLKLVAGMTAIPLDSLVQRDAQRKLRRVMAVTLFAFLGLLAMALLLVMAVRAQQEAQRQRQQAEGLVEYMLTDLRDKLKGVGRLDVMTAVNERAMGYYGAQGDLDRLTPESLDRRARILHAMGEDDEVRGDLDLALGKFEEAHRTTAAVLAKRPDKTDAIFAHAQSEYWLARVNGLKSNWSTALSGYHRYNDLAARLLAIDPYNADFMMESGWGALNIGIAKKDGFEQIAEAKEQFELAIEKFTVALKMRPDNIKTLQEIANAEGWLADCYYAKKLYKKSLDIRMIELSLKQRIVSKQPVNLGAQFQLAKAESAVGRNLMFLNKYPEARIFLKRSFIHLKDIAKNDPKNEFWDYQIRKSSGDLEFANSKLR